MNRYRLCCLTKNKTNPAYVGAQIGAARLAGELGCELLGFVPETADDVSEQIELIDRAIETRPDAILISPVHATALNAALQKIVDSGIVLVYFVTSSDGVAADSFMTSDNYALAADVADYLIKHLGEKGDIAVLEGLPRSPTTAPRTRAFLDRAAEYPGIDVVATAAGNYQYAEGKREMFNILARHEKLDGVISANDIMALGAIDAMDAVRRNLPIVGMNAMPDAIKAIKAGKLLATVSYDALSLVGLAVQAAIRILDGKPVPAVVEASAGIIHAGNCEYWDRPYEDRPLPRWDDVVKAAE